MKIKTEQHVWYCVDIDEIMLSTVERNAKLTEKEATKKEEEGDLEIYLGEL